jgi:hypothetical protein
MNKLDKIHKKDPKAIKDRDLAIRVSAVFLSSTSALLS